MGTPSVTSSSTDQQAMFDEQRRINAENMQNSMQMMRIQQEQQKQQEAISMLSNTLKNGHDGAMTIIGNSKA